MCLTFPTLRTGQTAYNHPSLQTYSISNTFYLRHILIIHEAICGFLSVYQEDTKHLLHL